MSNCKYTAADFRRIDPLFNEMSIKAITKLEWVEMSSHTLMRRRNQLGIPPYAPPKRSKPLSTADIDHLIRNMGGVMNYGG